MSKANDVRPVKLSESEAVVFRRLEKAKAALSRADKARREIEWCRTQLDAAFGAASLGRLPDGTLIMRHESVRHYQSLAARDVTVVSYASIADWDA